MGTDRRGAGGAIAAVAAMLGVALAIAGASAAARGPEAPAQEDPAANRQEPKEGRPPSAKARNVPRGPREKAGEPKADEPGGLRLPPADEAAEGLADRPGDDPLAPGGRGAMPAEGGRAPAPAPAAPADPNMPIVPRWPFLYEMTLASFDGAPLAARYYPSQLGANAPVLLLVHDLGAGRSSKDFDAPIAELDGQGLATHLQELGYAVMAIDLRGHGQSPSRERGTTGEAMNRMVGDLQTAYRFLLDRHNRRELNLAKLGVVALGEGANLAAAWAAAPGGAVSIEGRTSDLAGLALISARKEVAGRPLESSVSALAPRVPILLEAGASDAEASAAVDALRPAVERQRLSRVALIEARVPATNLLRFAPEATKPLLQFLDGAVKIRADEWEPRYNLDPVLFANVRVVNLGEEPGAAAPAPAPAPARGGEGAAAPPADRGRRPGD